MIGDGDKCSICNFHIVQHSCEMYNQMKSRASEVTMRCTHLDTPAPDMLHCTIYFAPHICALHCSTGRGHFL